MPVRHIPFWFDRFPKSRRPSFARLRGETEAGVVIVGGGLTGCACAWSFAAAGVKVVLLESGAIGAAQTAADAGLAREDFDAPFHQAVKAHGVRAARLLWQGMRRASLDFPAALRRLNVRCDLAGEDLVHYAPREADAAKRLRREYQDRRDAGFDHSWLTPAAVTREAALESGGAIRTRGASMDPYRACLGLAAAAASRGAAIHEKSAAVRIRARRKDVEVTTDGGSVRAGAVLIATSSPLRDLGALRRHLHPRSRYAVVTQSLPAAVGRDVGRRTAALHDSAVPPHLLRWIRDNRVLFCGADQPEAPGRTRERTLVQRTGQLMYELSTIYPAISGLRPEWAWDFTHYETVDGLPVIGPHRNFPRHYFALGRARHGVSFAWLASRVLLRQYQGEPAKGDDLLGFARIL